MAGQGRLSLALWAVDMCVFCLMLPSTSLPGAVLACLFCSVCLLQSPLTLSLTQAGLGSPATQGRKLRSLVGLVSCQFFIQPQNPPCRGWEYREPEFRAGDRGEFSGISAK